MARQQHQQQRQQQRQQQQQQQQQRQQQRHLHHGNTLLGLCSPKGKNHENIIDKTSDLNIT